MPNLFRVDGVAVREEPTGLIVAESAEQAEERFMARNEDSEYSIPIFSCYAHEITEIDGYKVVFKKGKKIALIKAGDAR